MQPISSVQRRGCSAAIGQTLRRFPPDAPAPYPPTTQAPRQYVSRCPRPPSLGAQRRSQPSGHLDCRQTGHHACSSQSAVVGLPSLPSIVPRTHTHTDTLAHTHTLAHTLHTHSHTHTHGIPTGCHQGAVVVQRQVRLGESPTARLANHPAWCSEHTEHANLALFLFLFLLLFLAIPIPIPVPVPVPVPTPAPVPGQLPTLAPDLPKLTWVHTRPKTAPLSSNT